MKAKVRTQCLSLEPKSSTVHRARIQPSNRSLSELICQRRRLAKFVACVDGNLSIGTSNISKIASSDVELPSGMHSNEMINL